MNYNPEQTDFIKQNRLMLRGILDTDLDAIKKKILQVEQFEPLVAQGRFLEDLIKQLDLLVEKKNISNTETEMKPRCI